MFESGENKQLNYILIKIISSCTKIFFESEIANKDKDENIKDLVKENDDQEMYFLNLEASYAPNSICIKYSKIIKEEQKCYVILRYFDIFKTLKNHIRNKHIGDNKNELIVNVDFIHENLKLTKINKYIFK